MTFVKLSECLSSGLGLCVAHGWNMVVLHGFVDFSSGWWNCQGDGGKSVKRREGGASKRIHGTRKVPGRIGGCGKSKLIEVKLIEVDQRESDRREVDQS